MTRGKLPQQNLILLRWGEQERAKGAGRANDAANQLFVSFAFKSVYVARDSTAFVSE